MKPFCPGRSASFQPGSMIKSWDVRTEQTPACTHSMHRQGNTCCWVFKLSVNHHSSSEGRQKELTTGKNRDTTCSPPNMGQKEWRNSFTKNTPLRVKLKLNLVQSKENKQTQCSDISFLEFLEFSSPPRARGWPGMLACTHTPFKNIMKQRVFSSKHQFVL